MFHEGGPCPFAGQAENAFRRAAEGVERMRRNLLEAGCGQRLQSRDFRVRTAFQLNRLAFRQGDEFAVFVGADIDIGVAENRLRDIEEVAGITAGVAAPRAVAVGREGFQHEDRSQRRVDHAQADRGVLGGLRQFGGEFGQGLGDDGRFLGRQRRQAEQAVDDRRIAGHFERAGLAFGEIDIPRRLDRDDQRRRRLGEQQRPLQTARVDAPADRGRARLARRERQIVAAVRVEAAALHQALEHFGAMLRAEAEGAQAGFVQAVGPQQAQDAEIFLADELRRVDQRAFDVPPFLGAVRELALGDLDAEMALVGRPFEQVEQLLAGARRAGLLLGDGDRRAAQIFDPGQHAGADAIRGGALLDGAQQHRGNVLAMAADRAGAGADQNLRAAACRRPAWRSPGRACARCRERPRE